ncbi:MAG: hypothetical protein OHK0037_13380 [Elainellaceae cyanobacterium]
MGQYEIYDNQMLTVFKPCGMKSQWQRNQQQRKLVGDAGQPAFMDKTFRNTFVPRVCVKM